MYKLGVNYEYSVNILREYNNSTSIKRSGGGTKRSSATGSALLQAFKEISKTNTQRTAQTAYLRGLNYFVRLFGEDRDTPLNLCSHLRHAAL